MYVSVSEGTCVLNEFWYNEFVKPFKLDDGLKTNWSLVALFSWWLLLLLLLVSVPLFDAHAAVLLEVVLLLFERRWFLNFSSRLHFARLFENQTWIRASGKSIFCANLSRA